MNWGVLYPLDNYIKVAKWDIKMMLICVLF